MKYNEQDKLDDVINQFYTLIKKYNIAYHDFFKESRLTYGNNTVLHIDLIVKLNNIELFIEFIQSFDSITRNNYIDISDNLYKKNRYFIIYTDDKYYLKEYSEYDNYETFEELSDLYDFILAKNKPVEIKGKFSSILKPAIKKYFKKNTEDISENNKIDAIIKLIDQCFDIDIKFDNNNNFYYFTEDISQANNFENQFFNLLLTELKIGDKIYRYGDLNLTFHTINSATCRLSGIPGMNDISEVGYVENYFDNSYIPLNSQAEMEQINNKFILCSSLLKDNLNQWRLYGDDCKGTSIEFEIIDEKSDFFIKKISYGTRKNYHFELEIINFILKKFSSLTNTELKLKTLSIWKHFFKSFEYSVEEEVRVLYKKEKNDNPKEVSWNLTYSHNILNPFISFNISDLPLKITNILFGAKCSEIDLNLKQFQYLASISSHSYIKEIQFQKSKIKNYR